MNEYERLCAYLKVVYNNLFSLHHNLVGGNWYSDHERLGGYYAAIGEILDELVERGCPLGIRSRPSARRYWPFQAMFCPAWNGKRKNPSVMSWRRTDPPPV